MRSFHYHTRGALGLCFSVLGLVLSTTAAHAAPKVTICHYSPDQATPKQIAVGASAAPDHLAHGDFLGPCSQDCRQNAAVCDDTNACTTDTCNTTNGTCGRTPVRCDDDNACTTDSCDTIQGCQTTPVSCDDGLACNTDSCDPTTGTCTHGSTCNDNDPCTVDSCTAEAGCTSVPVVCGAGQACDPGSGDCILDVCLEPPKTWSIIVVPSGDISQLLPGSFTSPQCCNVCWNTLGCAFWVSIDTDSQCYITTQPGATEAAQCPAGEQTIQYREGTESWNTGPCGVPDH